MFWAGCIIIRLSRFSEIKPNPAVLKILPFSMAKNFLVFPLEIKGDDLSVTMAEPTDTKVVEELYKKT